MRPWLPPLVLALACRQQGAVHIDVQAPEVAELSPLGDRLGSLTLIAELPGHPAETTTRPLTPGSPDVELGELPVSPGVQLSLIATLTSGRTLGFGRAAPVDITADAVVDVPILLRRPFVYVAGAGRLQVFDTTVEPGEDYSSEIDASGGPSAVATTPDGATVLVLSGASLFVVSTSTHAVESAPVDVGAGADDLAISPDSRWVVVSNPALGRVSFLDLSALEAFRVDVPVDSPGAVSIGSENAFVLVRPVVGGCTGNSGVVPIALGPLIAGAEISLGTAARDLAADPRGTEVYVAEPCRDTVTRVDTSGPADDVLSLPSASTVAVSGGRVWAMGRGLDASGAHLVLATALLDGSSANRIDMPVAEELGQSNDLTEPGESTEARLSADEIDPYDMAVLPDGAHVAVLVNAHYHADEIVRTVIIDGFPSDWVILPTMDMDTYKYLLVDVSTGSMVQRMRSLCSVDWDMGVALLDDWSCAPESGQEMPSSPYVPSHLAVLYGDR